MTKQVIFPALFVATYSVFCLARENACDALAKLYENSPKAEIALRSLTPTAQNELADVFAKSHGDYIKELEALSAVFMDDFRRNLPPDLKPVFDGAIKDYQTTRIESAQARKEQDLADLKSDPTALLLRGLRERQEIEASAGKADIPREFYGVRAAFCLELMKEAQRLTHYQASPFWKTVPVLAISNPLPIESVDRYRQTEVLAARQWDYLNLIPVKYHPRILEELEAERKRFIERAQYDDQRKEIDEQFKQMKELVQEGNSLSREDFIKSQKKKFNWKQQLVWEYSLKTIWAGLLSFMVWATL